MLIWILTFLLLALGAAAGYLLGAIRTLVLTLGLLLSASLGALLGTLLRPLLAFATSNEVLLWLLPPLIGFFLLFCLFFVVAWLVHRKADLYYKYRAGDYDYIRWDHLNRRLGLPLGMLSGAVAVLLVGWVIHVFGYLAVQLHTHGTESALVRFLAAARHDLRETGLERPIAAMDWMPAKYYQAADVAGLVYHNPVLVGRLSQYPPYLMLGESEEFQQLRAGTEFNSLLLSQADPMALLRHPSVQPILSSPDLISQILNPDLEDLRAHLETGESPAFEEEQILGRWRLDPHSTMAQQRRRRPNMPAAELAAMRQAMEMLGPAIKLLATPDQRVILKIDFNQGQAQPEPEAEDPSGGYEQDPYGRYAPPGRPAPTPPPAPQAEVALSSIPANEGSWEREGFRYRLHMPNPLTGQTDSIEATADPERLVVLSSEMTMVFIKDD